MTTPRRIPGSIEMRRINRHPPRRPERRQYGAFVCECGKVFVSPVANVSSGKTRSCGCLSSKAQIGDRSRTHGQSHTETYRIWCGMHKRCEDPSFNKFNLYGGRGIRVCERWGGQGGFQNFLDDMGHRPHGHSIDRIDQDGNYEPGNCRWASSKDQARNTRTNRYLTIDGVTKTTAEWAEIGGITRNALYYRLKRGWTAEKSVFGTEGEV